MDQSRRSRSTPIQPLKIPAWQQQPISPPIAESPSVPPPFDQAEAEAVISAGAAPIPNRLAKLTEQLVIEVIPPIPRLHLPRYRLTRQSLNWLIVWLSTLCILGGMSTAAFLWLTGLPPLPECRSVSPSASDSSPMQRLYCAQQIARSGKLTDLLQGIELLKGWSPDQPFYEKARQSVDDWSALVLLNAREKVEQNDLAGGLEAAGQIPVSSGVYQQAQEAIASWKAEWHKGDVLYAKAEVAMQTQNWKEASALVIEMGFMKYDYWRLQQADALGKRVLREKEARQSLTQAQKLAKGNDPAKLGEAIVLLQAVSPGTMASPEAEAARQQWSQTLLNWALQQWQQGNTDAALLAAQKIPFDPNLPPAGKDLIQFSQAQQQTSGLANLPIAQQLWNLLEATAAIQQINADSPFYAEAQARSQSWVAQLQDITALQFAEVLASLGDRTSLEAAIERASQLTPDRPGRLTAQSLIARWQEELAKLRDRPYLARAQAMAASNEKADLQQAIAQAQVIPTDQPLWQTAQTQILDWKKQIEVIEDQPLLDDAIALAKQNKLNDAIAAAGKIQPGRALHEQAQAQIQTWQGQIRNAQIAQDQPILTQANALAAKGHLTMAIDLAARIQPGRELYDQAQQSIKTWLEERDGSFESIEESSETETNETEIFEDWESEEAPIE
ncbi:hypothetical protein IFO70_06185 [Phormidium tenue FACHB-886]|nr:hypothetical protein [Phormidium tenue FACHB-886]